MYNLIMIFLLFFIIVFILFFINLILSKKNYISKNKLSPFECGFNPQNLTRMPFSLHFFFITVIFLIFDIEIVIILPSILIFNLNNLMTWTMTMSYFIIILIIGIYHEWNSMMIQWIN